MSVEFQKQKNPEGLMLCPTGLELYAAGHTLCPAHNVELQEHQIDVLIGELINERYQIKESLTAGGWASIYRALDIIDNRDLAVKVMHSYLLSDAEAVARFKREGKAASALTHEHLAHIYDAGVMPGGQPYIVMELVRGITLTERLATLGELTAEQAIPMFIKVCNALSAAHEIGIIHRDIKPSNLMLGQHQGGQLQVKVVDFGLARAMESSGLDIDQITRSGQTLGSPAYMSPEQCLGYKLDARSDIYSLGCTMYEAVSGKPPFEALSILEFMHKHTYEEPAAVQIRSGEANFGYNMAHAIMQALEKKPDSRQQSMLQLRDQLQACMWQLPQPAAADLPPPTGNSGKERALTLPKAPASVTRLQGWLSLIAPLVLLAALAVLFVYVVRQGQPGASAGKPAPTVEQHRTTLSNDHQHHVRHK